MGTKKFALASLVLISVGLIVIILFNVNPGETSFFVKSVLFISIWYVLFYVLLSLLAALKTEWIVALRRSAICSMAIVGILFFLSIGVFNLLSALTFLVALTLIELFFSYKKVT
ncbi:hypothetical protein COT77_00515 [Candidatus Berkelbacteria bacterium CG10_big_fil_rev_8_21_14_0_10_41_12]|uniref:Uncharacterized protein n=1 Tax=Candidatus Berkelbacteria bacterium CG10_big_fil_rev_8_21_14_0_10_41_12 TaxID=1974513 RepID=A0A2M6WXR5_9BACT|nr:MAG: hypothetical protein COT77_00515 [Candidatus Berkelbacteria bacterium CG10_big_fil_rev_8_21_14_0_10_41_12]